MDVVPKLSANGYRLIVPYLRGYRVIVPYPRGYGTTSFVSPSTPRSAEQAALGKDIIDLMHALGIDKAIFAGYDWGSVAVNVAGSLYRHGGCEFILDPEPSNGVGPSARNSPQWNWTQAQMDAAVPAFRNPD